MADHHPTHLLGGACAADHLDFGMGHQRSNAETGTEECESIFKWEGSEGEERGIKIFIINKMLFKKGEKK